MSLIKNSSIYLFSNIFNALIPFLLLPILTHKLSPVEYGQIAMLQTLVSGISALTGLNAVGAANRRYYDDSSQIELARYNGSCVYILIFSSLSLYIFAYCFGDFIASILSIPLNWIYLSIVISSGLFIVQLRLGQWQIREQALKYGFLQIMQSLLLFSLTIVLLLCFKQGVLSRVYSWVWAIILSVVVSLLTLYRDKLLSLKKINLEYIRDALKFGVPLVPHIIGIFFLSAIDRIIINDHMGVGEAGIYMLGVQLSLGMVVVFDAINKAYVPWLFKTLTSNDNVKLNKLARFTYVYFLILICLGVLSFWVGPFVVKLVASTEYLRATTFIGWLCLGQAFNGMYLMVTNYLFYAKKTGRLSIVTISCGLLNIVLIFLVINPLGITGVAIAFSVSMFIRFLATWWLASTTCNLSWKLIANKP